MSHKISTKKNKKNNVTQNLCENKIPQNNKKVYLTSTEISIFFLKVSNLDFNSNNRCTPNRNTTHHHRENLPGGFSQFHYNVKKHKRIFQQLLIKP